MTKVFLGVLLATVILAGGVPAEAQDKATIDRLNESFAAAFNTGDIATVAAMYTDDAFVLPPGAPLIQGRAAIQAFWKSAGAEISDLKLTTIDVKPLGNDAAREILHAQDQRSATAGGCGQVCRGVGEGRRELEASRRYLEHG